MPLYLFTCTCGNTIEAIRKVGVESVDCTCGGQAQRHHVYATSIGGRARPPVSERRVSLRQYTEASEQIAYEHAKAEESAQKPLPPPPLWEMAKARAKQLEKAGVHDSMDLRPGE